MKLVKVIAHIDIQYDNVLMIDNLCYLPGFVVLFGGFQA